MYLSLCLLDSVLFGVYWHVLVFRSFRTVFIVLLYGYLLYATLKSIDATCMELSCKVAVFWRNTTKVIRKHLRWKYRRLAHASYTCHKNLHVSLIFDGTHLRTLEGAWFTKSGGPGIIGFVHQPCKVSLLHFCIWLQERRFLRLLPPQCADGPGSSTAQEASWCSQEPRSGSAAAVGRGKTRTAGHNVISVWC